MRGISGQLAALCMVALQVVAPAMAQAPNGNAGPGSNVGNGADTAPGLISPAPTAAQLRWNAVMGLDVMHFAIIPHGHANTLLAWGPVDNGVSVRFRAALDAARPIDEVAIYSPGGSLEDGLEIGRIIHARKLATHVLQGQRCVSACNFMFMGGVIRYIDIGATFEVHMFSNNQVEDLKRHLVSPPRTYQALMRRYPSVTFGMVVGAIVKSYPQFEPALQNFQTVATNVRKQSDLDSTDNVAVALETVRQIVSTYNQAHPDSKIEEREVIVRMMLDEDVKTIQMDSAQTAAEIAKYLTEMGLSLRFLTRFAAIHNDQPTDLSRAELREFNVINTD